MSEGPDLLGTERRIRDLLQVVPLSVLGKRIAAHRTAAGLSIRDLASHAMVSKTSVVNLEHGRACQPATLAKICAGLNLHLDRLIDDTDKVAKEGAAAHHLSDYRWFDLSGLNTGPLADRDLTLGERQELRKDGVDAMMTMFRNVPSEAGILPGIVELTQPTESRSHHGAEWVYVLSGVAAITVDQRTFVLHPGESLYIGPMTPHHYGPQTGSLGPVSLLLILKG